MDAAVVTTPSRARDFIIKRPRLTKLLDEARSRLLLLVAPAGYGKTTLAREWTAQRDRTGWYAGGPAMADVAALCVGVVEVLAAMSAPAREEVVERVRILAARGHDPRGLAKAVAGAAPGPDALLVIDDYQYIAESDDAEAFIDELVGLTEFRLLLTSRERPGWLAARRVVYGEATVIEMDELAFTDDEAREVLGEAKAGRDQILAEAQGWPAVIGLVAARRTTGGAMSEVQPSEIFDFVAEDLFRSASTDLRKGLFMLALSGDAGPDLVRELLGDRCGEILTEATDRGFLTSDPRPTLHPLLRAFLISQMRELGAHEIDEIVGLVVGRLSEEKRWDGCLFALEHFPRADAISTTLSLGLRDLLDFGRVATVSRWVLLATSQAITDPLLLLAESEVALRLGDNSQAQVLGECAGGLLDGDLAARAHLVAARGAHLRGDTDGVQRNCERVAATDAQLRTRADALWVAFSSARERSTVEATAVLDQLKGLGHPDIAHALRLLGAEGVLLADAGDVRRGLEQLQLARSLFARVHDPFARSNLLQFIAFANLLLARYEDSIAATDLQLAEGRESGLEFVIEHGLLRRAGALIGLRRFAAAQRTVDELERRPSSPSSHAKDNVVLQLARLRIGLGDLAGAASLLQHEPIEERPTYLSELLAHRALVAAAMGNITGAEESIGCRAEHFGYAESGAMSELAETVIALQRGSEPADQAATLSRLVAFGQLDAIVTACRSYPQLATVATQDKDLARAVGETLAASNDTDIAKHAALPITRRRRPRQRLSPREQEVYELLVQGRANHEIAKTLFISQSTAKLHVRHIYEKLGVHSRAEAARIAALDERT
jgi:LuxR family transcriptional regulator, maltose regulon positive regulatory protein